MGFSIRRCTAAVAILLAIGGCSHGSGHPHGAAQPASGEPTTVDIQGADEWKRSTHMHSYYDLTVATFANNHSKDQDLGGIVQTRKHLAEAGLMSVGAGANLKEAWKPLCFEKNGLRLCFLAFTRFMNGLHNDDDVKQPQVPIASVSAGLGPTVTAPPPVPEVPPPWPAPPPEPSPPPAPPPMEPASAGAVVVVITSLGPRVAPPASRDT